MDRIEQLKFCKICQEKKFDIKQGIICGLTNLPADFEESCDSFKENTALKEQYNSSLKASETRNKMASTGKRFANYLLDLVFIQIFAYFFGMALAIMLLIFSPEHLSIFEERNRLLDHLLGFIVGMIYYLLFEGITARTPAKLITRTKVITLDEKTPDFKTVFIRSLCRFVPFDALSFLGVEGAGWHDKWSKTMVVNI